MPHRREVAVARVLGRLRHCRRQRTVGHVNDQHISECIECDVTIEYLGQNSRVITIE